MLGLRARERWSHWSLLPFYEDEATAANVHRMMTRKVDGGRWLGIKGIDWCQGG